MSSDSEELHHLLELEVRRLRIELTELKETVQRQGAQIAALAAKEDWEVVSTTEATSTGASGSAAAAAGARTSQDWPVPWSIREEIAKEIGESIRRRLAGERVHSSGREKLSGFKNRYYLVARNFEGVRFDPIQVLTSYQKLEELNCRKGRWGETIWVGIPTQKEGIIVADAAGLSWPAKPSQ